MRCFADTSFYIAVLNPGDAHQKTARTFISVSRGFEEDFLDEAVHDALEGGGVA